MTTRRNKHTIRTKSSVFLILGLSLTLLISCSKDKEVIPEGEMATLIAEMALADSYRDSGVGNIPDSVRRNLGEAILARHGYTYAQMDSSLNWYGRHLDKYYSLYAKADKEIQKRQRKIAKMEGKSSIDETGENLWPYADHIWVSPLGVTDGLNFSLDGNSLLKGENLEWKLRLNHSANMKAILGVEYTDGSVSYSNSGSFGEKRIKVEIITDTAKRVKRIIGLLHVDRSAMPLWIDSVQLNKLPFDSTIYYRIRSQKSYSR